MPHGLKEQEENRELVIFQQLIGMKIFNITQFKLCWNFKSNQSLISLCLIELHDFRINHVDIE